MIETAAESEARLLRERVGQLDEEVAALKRRRVRDRNVSDARAKRFRRWTTGGIVYALIMAAAVTFFAVTQFRTAMQQQEILDRLDSGRVNRDAQVAVLTYAACQALRSSDQNEDVTEAEEDLRCEEVLAAPRPSASLPTQGATATPAPGAAGTPAVPSPSSSRSTGSSPAVGGALPVVPGGTVVATSPAPTVTTTATATVTPPATSTTPGLLPGIVCPVTTGLPVLGPILC